MLGEKKPASRLLDPRRRVMSPEERQKQTDLAVARDRKRWALANEARRDKIGEFLGSTFHRTHEAWPHLKGPDGQPVSVHRYYPTLNVALDIFPALTEADERAVADKRRILGAAGIRYGALTYDMELVGLVPQIGLT